MSPAFLACIAGVLAEEAGFQRDALDPGNWTGGSPGIGALVGTNRGIAAPTLYAWRKTPISEADMRALSVEEAEAIYADRYWSPIRGDSLPLPLAYATLDAAVNSGTRRAGMWLQGALGCAQDGVIGSGTIGAAVRCGDLEGALRGACERRLVFLRGLPTWPRYGSGWAARVGRVETAARKLIEATPPATGATGGL